MPDNPGLLGGATDPATGAPAPSTGVGGSTAPVEAMPSPESFVDTSVAAVAARSQGRAILRRFLRHRLAMASLVLFVAILLLDEIGSRLWPYTYSQLTDALNSGPTGGHPFGTDGVGHDMFAQVMRASLTSIELSLVVAAVSMVIGVAIGALAGYYRSWPEAFLMRFTDLILTIPILAILLVLSRQAARHAGSWLFIGLIIGFVIWTSVARLVRGALLSLRERDFIEAARALGAGDGRIILRHLLPNAVGPIIVNTTLSVATAILLESTLSFLGLGVQPPQTSLGLLISQNQGAATTEWWLFAFPAIFLVVIVLCVNFIGDGLRDAFDPRQTRVRA